jgi:septal ring factor EnvC (AmiA/AmiB activator)
LEEKKGKVDRSEPAELKANVQDYMAYISQMATMLIQLETGNNNLLILNKGLETEKNSLEDDKRNLTGEVSRLTGEVARLQGIIDTDHPAEIADRLDKLKKVFDQFHADTIDKLTQSHVDEIALKTQQIADQAKIIADLQKKQTEQQQKMAENEALLQNTIDELQKKFDAAKGILTKFSTDCPAAYKVPLPLSSNYTVRMFVNNKTKKLR